MKRSTQPLPRARAESRRALDAEEGELALVVVGDELTAVVVAELQAASGAPAKPPKAVRTPWRSGSSASKRVARRAAWMPTHSVEQ